MTAPDRFDRHFSDLLADLAEPEFPDYFDDVLAAAVSRPQRPTWTFPERWLPMSAITRRLVLVPGVPWRTVALLALLMVLLVTTLLVVGAQRRVPAPFGPAANGLIAYSAEGDIYTRDPVSGVISAIVTGASEDVGPVFSRDGTRLAFIRVVSPGREMLMVSSVDGSDVRPVTETRDRLDWWEWSPDGSRLAFVSLVNDLPTISVAPADGSSAPRALEVGMPAGLVMWRPPDGSELIFRGTGSGARTGIFAVDPDGGAPRPLTPTDGDLQYGYMGVYGMSPDGTRLTYTEWENRVLRVHVLNLDTGEDQTRIGPQEEADAVFSPDGRLLAFNVRETSTAAGADVRVHVGPIDDPSVTTPVGPASSADSSGNVDLGYDFSPDGTKLVISQFREFTFSIADVTGGEGTVVAETDTLPNWQRLAP